MLSEFGHNGSPVASPKSDLAKVREHMGAQSSEFEDGSHLGEEADVFRIQPIGSGTSPTPGTPPASDPEQPTSKAERRGEGAGRKGSGALRRAMPEAKQPQNCQRRCQPQWAESRGGGGADRRRTWSSIHRRPSLSSCTCRGVPSPTNCSAMCCVVALLPRAATNMFPLQGVRRRAVANSSCRLCLCGRVTCGDLWSRIGSREASG